MPLSTLRLIPRGITRKTQGQDGVAFSFPVGILPPLQHAGLTRRTPSVCSNSGSRLQTIFGPLVSLRVLGWPPPRRRDRLLPTSQPSKLRIQRRDCLGDGLDRRNGPLDGLQRSVQLGLSAGSLVAPIGSSAARPNTAQFLGGLVEQDVGVVGHGVSRHTIHHFSRAH